VVKSFTVTINAVNQAPTLDPIPDIVLAENAGNQTVNLTGVSSGASNEVQTLTVSAVSDNKNLIPNATVNYTSPSSTGTLSFAPLANVYGAANISVTVNDGGASNNSVVRSFSVTVNPVNQPPTLDSISDVIIDENVGVQTINLTGISSG